MAFLLGVLLPQSRTLVHDLSVFKNNFSCRLEEVCQALQHNAKLRNFTSFTISMLLMYVTNGIQMDAWEMVIVAKQHYLMR